MTVNAIAGTTTKPVPAPTTPTTTSTSNTTLDRQAFLKLLVAQLKYQDPSKPMDASAMVSQSAQLSVVDKLDDISNTLKSSGLTDQLMLAGSVVGKVVTFKGPDGTAISQPVTAVRLVNGSMVLTAGSWDVPISAVTSLAAA
jgi:flagellar basal-body rod modification protein FlgD